jgi:hypothetical protein
LDHPPAGLDNHNAVQLEHYLTGWYTGGQKQFDGESTVILLRQLRIQESALGYLAATAADLGQVQQILDSRTGRGPAAQIQGMDYERLAQIRQRIREVVQRLSTG